MTEIIFSIVAFIIGFIIGLTFFIEYKRPYYEIRGYFVIEQRLLGIGYIYTWSGPGFCEYYPPEWNVYRGTVRQ